ncbi:MAG: hypothetical protein A3A44_01200 [Candidatus Sungbacteria bacterium RIFCSPLOWO2_01_FULL_60_25]|uniref:Cation-transporting P-type ATPase N-terminal domain-containing protein n=1 Tax=Candidatus Sungbacteria bacterium RIFCSPLOWO2_01_FULL_60_25 TaxID=1802281 RepID=A0A1G2LF16_9BACT|nr:MAG: hypothetical protein A3A44_01200 [Candidatus Sungbacteria bacterium RIFCSPLOWO2_01_FULL_60_25]
MSSADVFTAFDAAPEGLRSAEAARRLEDGGRNEIAVAVRDGRARIFLRQFANALILLLVGAALVAAAFGEWIEAGVIIAAVIANVLLGYWQEAKAENALALLRTYVRTRARVRREGAEHDIDAAELVPGDLVRVSRGDRVPADCRIVFAVGLEADEAVLTGESFPAKKSADAVSPDAALGDRSSMLFGGTLVVAGVADAAVVATANATEFGAIASLVGRADREPTPLQRSLNRFVLWVSGTLGVFIVALFGLGVSTGYGAYEMFLLAVAVAVSAVPEGMPVALTVTLAIGVERLARQKGVVRRLLAAETLGATSVILTDKTGTLTQARMEVASVVAFDDDGQPDDAVRALLADALVNTDVIVENPAAPAEEWQLVGRPLEVALVRRASREGLRLPEVLRANAIVDRLPFNSVGKFSATLARRDGRGRIVLLGAPDVLIRFTDFDAAARAALIADIDRYAASGAKVVGVAVRDAPASQEQLPPEDAFAGFRFSGLITLRDPLRPEAKAAIERIARAGVRTVMATGDHRGTAEAVAREIGLINGVGAVMTGSELAMLSDEAWQRRADEIAVYARVTPADKVRITELFRKRGEVVAVTGDGVNDAPALHAADIGVAVGSGTDVAKSAADLVILDDNFETLILAVEEGRSILANIRKVVVYLLATSLDEIFLIGGALLVGVPLPLSALQILFVNFFSDSFPAIALAFERGDGREGHRPAARSLLDGQSRALILATALLNASLLFALYLLLLGYGFAPELVRTFIFASFATYALGFVFSVRSLGRGLFSLNPFGNRPLIGGVLVGLALTALAVYTPFLQRVFGTVPLPPSWAGGVLLVGIAGITVVECGKRLFRVRSL